jgi:hypothetical protein
MASPQLRLMLDKLVCHQPGGVLGLVVGVIFEPSQVAVVQWCDGPCTIERHDDLIKANRIVR